jgi:hypothetical protein
MEVLGLGLELQGRSEKRAWFVRVCSWILMGLMWILAVIA